MSIAIVTDSTCDLTADLLEEYPIHIIPNILVIDGQSLEDGKGISRQEFYERLPSMKTLPTTAAASAGSFQVLYERLLQNGAQNIISIHAPALLSGIFNAASLAAQPFDNQVKIIDSGQVSLGLGFQVLAAAQAAMQGMPLEAILAEMNAVRRRIRLVAMLDTLEYVRRSGRVSWARARLGNLLDLKPIIGLSEGKVLELGKTRSRAKGKTLLLTMLNNLGPLDRLAILHTNAEKDSANFLSEITNEVHAKPFLVNVTTAIGTHVGPNGLGFVAVTH